MSAHEIIVRVVVEQASPAATPTDQFQEVGKRTPSQRMRLALLARHKALSIKMPFEQYYEEEMQRIIDLINKVTKG